MKRVANAKSSVFVPYNLVFLFKVGPGVLLCNVGEICAMLAWHLQQHYQKINWFKKKNKKKNCQKFRCYSDDTALGFFLCNVVWSLLGNIAQGFCLCNIVPRVLQHYWTGSFHVQMQCCLEPLGQHCIRFSPMQSCPKSIKTTLNKIFPVQCFLEPLGQHGTRFFELLCAMLP